ncbi:MAG: ANTAR domain-containing protein [Proteobacteria bacterium]|nr:ANTAR domain-containing protein [Pseudomonadota bacterium]
MSIAFIGLGNMGSGMAANQARSGRPVRAFDLSAAALQRAEEVGVASMLAVQMYVDGEDLGALNLASAQVGAFDDESEHVALLFASHAAVAMAGAQRQEQLRTGMQRRDVIGQAKGILMERHKINGDQAFSVLVGVSQSTNRKPHDIADELVHTGAVAS